MWDLIVSVPDHCLTFYFIKTCRNIKNAFIITFCNIFLFNSIQHSVRFGQASARVNPYVDIGYFRCTEGCRPDHNFLC